MLLAKGEDAINSLDIERYFYFVMGGKLKIYEIDFQTSKEQTLYLFSRGDMFDVVSLLDGGTKREYLSEVLEDVNLIQVPLLTIHEMILQDEKFRHFFYKYLALQLKSMEELAISLSLYDVNKRILRLFTKFTTVKDNKATLKVVDNLKHEELASMIGTVRKVLNRSLQKLKKDGIINLSRRNIDINDFQKLLDRLNI
ncbi:MAG: Crp/Fnr family transcriptional regulator [Sulfurimonas sp.]|nr:Crp/Fnr family transcriptional regulator [Sulfurimonas sp.]